MKTLFKIFVTVGLLVSFAAQAQSDRPRNERKQSRTGRAYRLPAYGMAGCGTGTLIFPHSNKRQDIGIQLIAATVNDAPFIIPSAVTVLTGGAVAVNSSFGISGAPSSAQSTSIASGSSNCNEMPMDEEAMRMERETYVAVNMSNLNKEASQGNGAHLQSFAELIGCGDEKNFSTFARIAQVSHTEIFSDAEPESVTERLLTKARGNTDLRSCLRAK